MGRDPPRAEQYIIIMIVEVLKIIPMMLVSGQAQEGHQQTICGSQRGKQEHLG